MSILFIHSKFFLDNLNDLNLNAGGDEFNANQPTHKDNRASFNENRHTDSYQAPAARPSSSSTKPESTNLDYYGNEQTESSCKLFFKFSY